jgi:23S rRNA maturation mini-RNase III
VETEVSEVTEVVTEEAEEIDTNKYQIKSLAFSYAGDFVFSFFFKNVTINIYFND